MALKILDSKLDLLSMYLYTKSSTQFSNRFDYMDRDVLKTINIQEIKEYDRVEQKLKSTYYKIVVISNSYPNYGNYINHLRKGAKKQRKYKHTYQTTIELLSLHMNSKVRFRVGSDRKWVHNPPKSQIKTVSFAERRRIRSQVESIMSGKTKKLQNEEYRKRIKKHKDQAKYLDVGDYNAKKIGVNGDFWFRLSNILRDYGALYGKYFCENPEEGILYPFMPKHLLRVIEVLLKSGKLKYEKRY